MSGGASRSFMTQLSNTRSVPVKIDYMSILTILWPLLHNHQLFANFSNLWAFSRIHSCGLNLCDNLARHLAPLHGKQDPYWGLAPVQFPYDLWFITGAKGLTDGPP